MWSTLAPALGSPVPCTRSKLAVCVHDGHVYMLGGRNGNVPVRDFWKYSLTEHTWTEIRSGGDVPSNLQDHTVVGFKGRLYVFGGEVGFASTGETPLWVYDIATTHWRKLSQKGTSPKPQGRRGHTAVVHLGAMYIYGGYRDLKGSTNELWCFNFEQEMWHQATFKGSSEVPPARHNHSVVVHDSAMYIYGGMTDLQAKCDFWKWDFVSRRWSRVRCKGGPGDLQGHTACKVMSSMVVFGGERSGQLLNEIWRFHFATDTWERLVFTGSQPEARSRHFAVVVPTLLLLLPQLYDGNQQQSTPQHRQRQFQDLVSSGSYAPSYSPNDSWELNPPPAPRLLPKSETISNCREAANNSSVGAGYSDDPSVGNRKIPSSASHTNFKYLKERISTSNLFKPQNASYMALSNSSESVQDDSDASDTRGILANHHHQNSVIMRSTQSSYNVPMGLNSKMGSAVTNSNTNTTPAAPGTNKNNCVVGGNGRLSYARTLLSVPNFQRIQNLELRGLMEDLSDSSSADLPPVAVVRGTANHDQVDNQVYADVPRRNASKTSTMIGTNVHHQRRSLFLPQELKRLAGGGADLETVDNDNFCFGVSLTAQDSLENIPDIKDYVTSTSNIDNNKHLLQQEGDTRSLKLIDLEADDCCEDLKSPSTNAGDDVGNGESGVNTTTTAISTANDSGMTSMSPETPETPVFPNMPKSFSCLENVRNRRSLPVVNENMAWDSHRDYASCLNDVVTTPDNRRWSNLEMKMFQRLADFDEGISEDMFFEEGPLSVGGGTQHNNHHHHNRLQSSNEPSPSDDQRSKNTHSDYGTPTSPMCDDSVGGVTTRIQYDSATTTTTTVPTKQPQSSRHFSMLVLGGREQGINGCGRRPVTVWKIDFWK